MNWIGLAINGFGVIIGVVGLVWTFLGHRQNEKLERLIITEKKMFRDRILDMRQTLESRRDQILVDREAFNDPTRNQVSIRIEDLEGMIENLQRFADRLEDLE